MRKMTSIININYNAQKQGIRLIWVKSIIKYIGLIIRCLLELP